MDNNFTVTQLLKTIETILMEFNRSFILLSNLLAKIDTNSSQIIESVSELRKVLTNDKDGLRKLIFEVLEEKKYKQQSWLNLRTSIITLITAIISIGLTYLFTKT